VLKGTIPNGVEWVTKEYNSHALLHMHAGGLQVLDHMPAAILVQLLQHVPLASVPFNNLHALFNLNGASAPSFAAFNKAADDTVSVYMLVI